MAICRITKLAVGALAPLLRGTQPVRDGVEGPGALGDAGESGPGEGSASGDNEGLLGSFEYRACLVVLLPGMFSAAFSWWLGNSAREANPINGVTDLLLAALCVVLVALLLCRRERVVELVERIGYVGVGLYFVADKYYVVYSGDRRSIPVDSVSEVFSWTPAIYILAYLIFGAGRGLAISATFYVLLLAAGVPHMAQNLASGVNSAGSTCSTSFTWRTSSSSSSSTCSAAL